MPNAQRVTAPLAPYSYQLQGGITLHSPTQVELTRLQKLFAHEHVYPPMVLLHTAIPAVNGNDVQLSVPLAHSLISAEAVQEQHASWLSKLHAPWNQVLCTIASFRTLPMTNSVGLQGVPPCFINQLQRRCIVWRLLDQPVAQVEGEKTQ